MIDFSTYALEIIRWQADEALAALSGEKPLREKLAEMYVKGLPDKSTRQGEMMADNVIEIVAHFTSECDKAMTGGDKWAGDWIHSQINEMSLLERCQFLFRLTGAFVATNAIALKQHMQDGSIKTEQLIAEIENETLDPASINEALEKELFEQAVASLQNSSIFAGKLDALADLIEQSNPGEGLARRIVNYGVHTADYKALASMSAYIAAKNGILDEVPPETTLEEITIGVCASVETQLIAEDVSAGRMGMETAKGILKILGIVAAGFITVKLAIAGFTLGAICFNGIIGVLAAFLIGGVIVVKFGEAAFSLTKKAVDVTVDITAAIVKNVVKGLRMIGNAIKDTVIPAAINAVKKAAAFIGGLYRNGVAVSANTASLLSSTMKEGSA